MELDDIERELNKMLREFDDIRGNIELINISTKTTENYEFLLNKIDFFGKQIIKTRGDNSDNDIITVSDEDFSNKKSYLDYCMC